MLAHIRVPVVNHLALTAAVGHTIQTLDPLLPLTARSAQLVNIPHKPVRIVQIVLLVHMHQTRVRIPATCVQSITSSHTVDPLVVLVAVSGLARTI